MKKYDVYYRNEFVTSVEADNEDQAIYLAEQSDNWRFITPEGHKDLFEVKDFYE